MEDEDLAVEEALSDAHAEIMALRHALESERITQRELRRDRDDLVELVVYLENNLGDVSRELDYYRRSIRNVGLMKEKEKKTHETDWKEQIFANHNEEFRWEHQEKERNREVEKQWMKSLQQEVSNLRNTKNELLGENAILNERKSACEEIIHRQRSKLLDLRRRIEEMEGNEWADITAREIEVNFRSTVVNEYARGEDRCRDIKRRGEYVNVRENESGERTLEHMSTMCAGKDWKYGGTSSNRSCKTNVQIEGDSVDDNMDDNSVLSVDSGTSDAVPADHFHSPGRLIRNDSSRIVKRISHKERRFRHRIGEEEKVEVATRSLFYAPVVTGLRSMTKRWASSTISTVKPSAINDVRLDFYDDQAQ